MKKIIFLFAIFICLLCGCTSKSTNTASTPAPTQLNLSFETNPTKPSLNQPVTLLVKVTGNNKPVNNADVKFEVWTGKQAHHMLKTNRTGDGVYTITNTFPTAGMYNVVVHAFTPQVHQMIMDMFTIGSNEQEHKTVAGLLLHLQLPANAKSGQLTTIIGHAMLNNQVLTSANVEFEVWKDNSSKHDFSTKVTETKPGEYTGTYDFTTPGTYHIKMHVEKGKIHEHQEEMLIVM